MLKILYNKYIYTLHKKRINYFDVFVHERNFCCKSLLLSRRRCLTRRSYLSISAYRSLSTC